MAVTLCPGQTTGLSYAINEEKGGCNPVSLEEYRAVLYCKQGKG